MTLSHEKLMGRTVRERESVIVVVVVVHYTLYSFIHSFLANCDSTTRRTVLYHCKQRAVDMVISVYDSSFDFSTPSPPSGPRVRVCICMCVCAHARYACTRALDDLHTRAHACARVNTLTEDYPSTTMLQSSSPPKRHHLPLALLCR